MWKKPVVWFLSAAVLAGAAYTLDWAYEAWLLRQARGRVLRTGLQDSPPWYLANREGQFSGPAVDVINVAAVNLGLRLQWVVVNEGPEAAFRHKAVDVWPIMGRTPGRRRWIYITDPWMELPYWMVFSSEKAQSVVQGGEGLTIAARGSSITQQLIAEKYPKASVQPFESHADALQAVCSGKTMAAFLVESLLLSQAGETRGAPCVERQVQLSTLPVTAIGFGIGAEQSSPEARAAARALYREVVRLTREGTLTSLMLRWGQPSGEIRAFQERARSQGFSRMLAYVTLLLSLALLGLARYYRRLRQARQRLQYQAQILSQSSDAVLALNTGGRLTYWNHAAERLFDRPEGKALHAPAESVLPENLLAAIRAMKPAEESLDRNDGRRVFLEVSPSALLDETGRPLGVVANLRDVTRTRELEEHYRASLRIESLGRLAGGIAHDFNNLLTIISGWSQLLLNRGKLEESARSPVRQILHAAGQATQLTQQLLAFGRRQVLQPQVLDLNTPVSQVVEMLRRLIEASISVRLELAREPLPVKADPAQLSQVILNLALNARDAMMHGGTLTMRTRLMQRGGAVYACLAITDTGKGMDEATRERIFEPFFTTKEQGRGTGLGLATVYGTVHQSGGSIEVESQPGVGSTFTVLLPVTDEPLAPTRAAAGATEGSSALRVLLTEDEEGVVAFLKASLQEAGIAVYTAAGPTAVRAMMEEGLPEFDLLITDVIMPGGTGVDVANDLRTHRPGLKVLYISGYSHLELLAGELTRPEVAYLQKPFSGAALLEQIRKLCLVETPRE